MPVFFFLAMKREDDKYTMAAFQRKKVSLGD